MRSKSSGAIAALVSLGLGFVGPPDSKGQGAKRDELRTFMRQKLELSQRILEGITLEDYGLIRKNAAALRELSEDARWKVTPNVNYFRLSAQFQEIAGDLAGKAKARNLDGATLAFLDLTMSCVKCHKLVRDERLITFDGAGPRILIGRSGR